MKLILFLGSGISFPTLGVGVKQLTDSLLQDQWFRHTDGAYYPGASPTVYLTDLTRTLQGFLGILKVNADGYNVARGRGAANYEDLFYLARQLADDEKGIARNPGLGPFVDQVRAALSQHAAQARLPHLPDLAEVAEETCTFIQCVVRAKLTTTNTPLGLDPIAELARSPQVSSLDIVTLNHDLLVETFLESHGIVFSDGFGLPVGDVRYFDPSTFRGTQKIRLFKLHGSINWLRFRTRGADMFSDRYGIQVGGNQFICHDGNGELLDNLDITPHFLTGSFNKIVSYAYGPFAEMHWWFHKLLKEHDRVAMSGYGWNDKGINIRLMEWLHSTNPTRMCLMYRRPESLKDSDSPLRHRYDDLVQRGRIRPMGKWMQETDLNEIRTSLQ